MQGLMVETNHTIKYKKMNIVVLLTNVNERPIPLHWSHFTKLQGSGGALPLMFLHTRPFGTYLFEGVIYLAGKNIRWWYFTCKEPEKIRCDGILHVIVFQYFKIPYIICTFFAKLPIMNILDPNFIAHCFYDFRQCPPTELQGKNNTYLWEGGVHKQTLWYTLTSN